MGRQNIYDTLNVSSVMPKPMIQDVVDFLVKNTQFLLPQDKKTDAFKTRSPGSNLLSDIVHRLTVLGKDQAYSLIKFPPKTVALREAIDMTFLPIDLLQMKEMIPSSSKSLSLFSQLNDRLIINVTDITKANGDFSSLEQFHYRVVRDFLSRSFYVSTGNVWMSPTFVRYVAKVYSMTIGGQIARVFNLSPMIQMFIQTIFSAFFIGKMTSPDITLAFMKAHNRHLGLTDVADVAQIMAFIEDTLHKPVPDTLEEVCQVIDAYGGDQLRDRYGPKITRPVLNMRFASMFPESHVSTIALEYPPYFAFLILLVISGTRIGLSFPMKNMNMITEGKDVFDQLIKTPVFFNGL